MVGQLKRLLGKRVCMENFSDWLNKGLFFPKKNPVL